MPGLKAFASMQIRSTWGFSSKFCKFHQLICFLVSYIFWAIFHCLYFLSCCVVVAEKTNRTTRDKTTVRLNQNSATSYGSPCTHPVHGGTVFSIKTVPAYSFRWKRLHTQLCIEENAIELWAQRGLARLSLLAAVWGWVRPLVGHACSLSTAERPR